MTDGERQGKRARIELPGEDELRRVNELLRGVGGPNVSWGAANLLEVWIAETRLEAERQHARRMLAATWVLALATLGLVAATVGLIVVTVQQ